MNLSKIKKAYLIGIKGVMMTAIAQILKERGIAVSGSDIEEKFFTDEVLAKLKIPYSEHFAAKNVPSGVDLVIHSSAYTALTNVEVKVALDKGLRVLDHGQFLAEFTKTKFAIGIAGTHGKTTTTAMLGFVMKECGLDPCVMAGSKVLAFQSNACNGQSAYLVLEADEYKRNFLNYDLNVGVITSVDWDHPDIYPNFEEYKKAFQQFAVMIDKNEFLVAWGDSKTVREAASNTTCRVIYYGFGSENNYEAVKLSLTQFQVFQSGHGLGVFEIGIPGEHNILNALAVIAVTQSLGVDLERVREALKKFTGTARRFEKKGERHGVLVIDDYAHHPAEIKATLKMARELYPDKKIWTVFHPHTFTRTKALLGEFSESFGQADQVIVIDIYGSAREQHGGVHSRDLVELINKHQNNARYISTIEQSVEYLKEHVKAGDLVITMGAGDVWRAGEGLLKWLNC